MDPGLDSRGKQLSSVINDVKTSEGGVAQTVIDGSESEAHWIRQDGKALNSIDPDLPVQG